MTESDGKPSRASASSGSAASADATASNSSTRGRRVLYVGGAPRSAAGPSHSPRETRLTSRVDDRTVVTANEAEALSPSRAHQAPRPSNIACAKTSPTLRLCQPREDYRGSTSLARSTAPAHLLALFPAQAGAGVADLWQASRSAPRGGREGPRSGTPARYYIKRCGATARPVSRRSTAQHRRDRRFLRPLPAVEAEGRRRGRGRGGARVRARGHARDRIKASSPVERRGSRRLGGTAA